MILAAAIFFTVIAVGALFLVGMANGMSDAPSQDFQGGGIVIFLVIVAVIFWVLFASGVHIHTGITVTR